MGVYINGMGMPYSCYDCPLTNDGFYLCKGVKPYKQLETECEERKPDWCPLGNVPTPHGRLIDADELQRHFDRMANEEWNKNIAVSAASCFDDAAVIVEDAPTIIEREE